MIKKAPGVEDIFPDRIPLWNKISKTAREVFGVYNFKEIVTPIMEFTEVFSRGLGDETDIVSKEMFTFEDRGGRSLTLRPEGTASVVRAYVENGEYNRLATCKLFYCGPMFRAEKPQRGRLRQFNQIGAEFFGSDDPYYDYEVISLINLFCKKLNLQNYALLLNSIGCENCRQNYIAELKKYYSNCNEELCEDCQKRLDKNPLRLLDCKNKHCGELKNNAPKITDYLCAECKDHYANVKKYLDNEGISYTEDPALVRGLDYYTRTTFEFVTTQLGGQNAFAAGGRYNKLVEVFGGKPTPAVGFAAGMERIFLMLEEAEQLKSELNIYVVHGGEGALDKTIDLAVKLRQLGISVDFDPAATGFKSQFKKASRENAEYAIVIGEEEVKENFYTFKNMQTGEQSKITESELLTMLGEK